MAVNIDFPTSALLPKEETGAASFVNKYPEYDGRGTVIAIFDSGVDPGASGLQVTSDGKLKVIGRYDCSGARDVDTSTTVQNVGGYLLGLTGRKLKIPATWNNPSGNYHIGIKNAFEIYPKKVQQRIIKERKRKYWDPHHKTALANATNKSTILSREEILKKKEAEAQLDILKSLEKEHDDLGPVYDCVVFNDGEIWRVCLDTSEKGDLDSCHLMGEYVKTGQYVSLTAADQLNYSVNVHGDGDLLEIVGQCSLHGTHVACIAAANFPDEPEKNGVAPGAQIVSLTIADNRIGTMQTGTAISRAVIHIMNSNSGNENQRDIINMSYGHLANFSNSGRLGELMSEVVDKYKVVWVTSAGNDGPALCTMSAPPDIASPNIIGVGAYVSPEMMQAEYSLRQKLPGMPYTWSSRGPTIDGDKGVTICAPGAAITSVSNFFLRGTQLMNGTSMAAPHAAGCVGLLLSGLKAKKIPYSPFSVKRALENSTLYIDSLDPFAQGYGLLQVEKAFENLVNFHEAPERDVRFKIGCGLDNNKGIHIRNGNHNSPIEYGVTVEPIFADSDNFEPERKFEFQMSLALICSSPWVECPSYLEIMKFARTIIIRIDPTGLIHGVHNTCVQAYDVKNPEKGCVFRIEVTVVKPQIINLLEPELVLLGQYFEPNTTKRNFIMVPDEASWAVVKLKGEDKDLVGRFVVHCIQLLPKRSCKTMNFNKTVNVSGKNELTLGFQVKGVVVLEVVIAKYWANLGNMIVNYSISFHGCRPDSSAITMFHSDGIHSIDLFSGLHNEEISPSIQIKRIVSVLRPTEAKVYALSKRDIIPPGRQIYQILLTYTFHLNKGFIVKPNNSLLSNLLYESEFVSQMWMLFNNNKRLLTCGGAYPSKYNVKLKKGDYTILHQIRHEKKDLLEKVTDLPFLLSYKLPKEINVYAYGSQSQALIGGKKLTSALLPSGKHYLSIYIAPLTAERIQKVGISGHYFLGTIAFSKDKVGKKVDTYPLKYVIAEPGEERSTEINSYKTKLEEYEEALRELKVNWLKKFDNKEAAEKLYKELNETHSDHLAVHSAMMANLEPESGKEWPGISKSLDLATLNTIQNIAAKVIEAVDTKELLAYLGIKSDQGPDAAKIKQSMERQKEAIVDALARYGSVQCRTFVSDLESESPKPTLEDIDKTFLELCDSDSRFCDLNDKVTGHFGVWHARVHQHTGVW